MQEIVKARVATFPGCGGEAWAVHGSGSHDNERAQDSRRHPANFRQSCLEHEARALPCPRLRHPRLRPPKSMQKAMRCRFLLSEDPVHLSGPNRRLVTGPKFYSNAFTRKCILTTLFDAS